MKEFFDLLIHFKFKKLFLEKTENGFIQFFRFIFVGGIATLVDIAAGWFVVSFIFKQDVQIFGWTVDRDVASVAVGFIVGLITNYILSVLWIFRRNDINRLLEFLCFALIGIVGLFIKAGTVSLLGTFILDEDGVPFLIKSAIGTIVAFIWNFAARKLLLYRKKSKVE